MTLPAGNDNQINWKLLIETKEAVDNVGKLRKDIQGLKEEFLRIRSESGASFDQIAKSIESNFKKAIDDSRQRLRGLRDDLATMKTALAAAGTAGGAGAVGKSQIQADITATKEAIKQEQAALKEAQTNIEAYRRVVSFALSEVKKEMQETAVATTQVATAATQAGATTAGSFQAATANLSGFQQLVNSIKQQMLQMQQQTGENLKTISASLRLTFKEQGKRDIEDFRNQINQTTAAIKVLQQTINNPASNVDQGQLAQMRQQLAQLRAQLAQAQAGLKQAQQNSANMGAALSQATQQLNQTQNAATGLAGVFAKLNSVSQIFFGITLATLATTAMRNVVSFFTDAAQKALSLNKAIFQLEVGIRALRRSGIDITTSEMLGNLEKINESVGNLFSNLELITGAAEFSNLIRDLGLTKDQIFELQEAVVKLAVVNGRSMDDVQRTVALALSSGYTEGLQRLGVSINRLNIAEEANRIGFKGGYTALSEQARSQATYNLLVQKSTKYSNDLSEAQKRLFGTLQSNEAKLIDTKAALAEGLIPLQILWNKTLLGLVKILGSTGIGGAIRFISTMVTLVKVLPSVWEQATKSTEKFLDRLKFVGNFIKEAGQAFKDFKSLAASISKYTGFGETDIPVAEQENLMGQERLMSALEDFGDEAGDVAKDNADKLAKLEADFQQDLAEIAQEGKEKREKIWRDYWDDIAKIDREAIDEEAKILRDFQNKLSDIDVKLNFNLREADIRNQFDIETANFKLGEDIIKANEEFRQKELERERRYAEELLQIRENYLKDLDEALQDRDAKAVLRARKELILNKDRAARENQENKIKNQEALAEDITNAQKRRDARLRELAFELEQRRRELAAQAQLDREQAWRDYQQDLADFRVNLENKKKERAIQREIQLREQAIDEANDIARRTAKYQAELAELQSFNDEKLRMIGENLRQQAALLGLGSDEVLKVIKAYFGEGGLAQQVFQSYVKAVENYITQLKNLAAAFAPGKSFSVPDPSKFITTPTSPGFATGGAVVAKKPTQVTFGEVPEVAIFSPLNEINKLPSLLGMNGQGSANGRVDMRIALDSGLVATIVDQAAENVAITLAEVQRQ